MKVLVSPRIELSRCQQLVEAGHELITGPAGGPELLEAVRDVDSTLGLNISAAGMAQAPRLRGIVTPTIGLDRIDLAAATKHAILVSNSPSPANVNGVAEASIGMMIALCLGLKRKEGNLRNEGWGEEGDRGGLLMGRTLGLVGLGRIASSIARRLSTWEMRIIAYSPRTPQERFDALGVERVPALDDIFRLSDIVSVNVNLTPETDKFIGEQQIRLMKPTAYFVNMSRGQVVDQPALEAALRERRIAGAGLDVFTEEPLPADSPLREIDPDRIILTPHSLSHSWESYNGGFQMAVESTLALLSGELPAVVANPGAIPAWQAKFKSPITASTNV
jgi:phosphoglycerate dehydrogenase-like enzyme